MNWDELIPELKDWAIPQSPEGLAACEGRYPLAIGYLALFWPRFIEYDGMVFRSEGGMDEASVLSWLKTKKGNRPSVEAMLNHFHVLYIQHPGVWKDATEAQVKFIGKTLQEAWAAKLTQDFPHKQFVVELLEGTSERLDDYQVSFYQPFSGPSPGSTKELS